MSYVLTFGEGPDDYWMVNNEVSHWFFSMVLSRDDVDADVLHCLEMALYVNGLVFPDLKRRDPDLARRVVLHLQKVCSDLLQRDDEPPAPALAAKVRELNNRLEPIALAF